MHLFVAEVPNGMGLEKDLVHIYLLNKPQNHCVSYWIDVASSTISACCLYLISYPFIGTLIEALITTHLAVFWLIEGIENI